MNHRRFFRQVAGVLLLSGVMAGCAKKSAETPDAEDRVMIAPTVRSTVDDTAPDSGPADENTELTLYFMRADNPQPVGAGYLANYDNTRYVARRNPGSDRQNLAFTSPGAQYYNINDSNTLMRGWYPKEDEGGFTGGMGTASVQWTFDGSQDILVSNFLVGNRKDKGINGPDHWFEFGHMLTQLQFYVYAETEVAAQAWGKVISIQVKGQNNICKFEPTMNDMTSTGTPLQKCCSFSSAAALSDLSAYGIPAEGVAIPAKSAVAGSDGLYGASAAGGIMVQPLNTGATFTVAVTTELNGVQTVTDITVPDAKVNPRPSFAAGESTKVILNFLTRDIDILLKPDNWIPVSGDDLDVDLGVNEQ